MAVPHVRHDDDTDELSAMPDSFGASGWCAVFAVFAVAVLLVTYL